MKSPTNNQLKTRVSAKKVFVALLAASVLLGFAFSYLPESVIQGHNRDFEDAARVPTYSLTEDQADTLSHLFSQAAKLTSEGKTDAAIALWHHIIRRYPALPEAHVNLGFALVDADRYDAAEKSFEAALDLRPQQANAYWGLALVYEAQDRLPEAIGAMRAFIHLSADANFNNRARAAIWEWQAQIESKSKDHENKKQDQNDDSHASRQ